MIKKWLKGVVEKFVDRKKDKNMIELQAQTAWDMATSALIGQGFSETDARAISEEFVIAELAGTKTHGLGKLVSLNLGDMDAEPKVTDNGVILSVDGQKSNGFLLFRHITNLLIDKCKVNGMGVVFAHNFSRYSSLYPYTSAVAKAGYVGLLTNSAGPAAVAPFGSIDPITGTNPICFSFPKSGGDAQTFDFSTSEVVWGAIRQATLENKPLPYGAFIDSVGEMTQTPTDVNAVKAFGGTKGSALNLALEIVAGILSGGSVGLSCNDEYDCGAMFLAINPDLTGTSKEKFQSDLENLFNDIRKSRPVDEFSAVRVPGDSGRNARSISDNTELPLHVTDTVVQMMKRMASGESIAELSQNNLFN